MTLTITLPADVEIRLRAEAAAEGADPAALVVALVSDAFAAPTDTEWNDSIAAVRQALDEADEDAERGELLTVDEAFSALRRNANARRQERSRGAGAA